MRSSTRLLATLLLALAACSDPAGTRPGDPAQAEVVSGDLQLATVGTALVQPLVVVVQDARGRPVPGVALSFVVTAGGGSVASAAVVSDGSGSAQNSWTLGTVAGDTQRVEVRLAQGGGVLAEFRAVGQAGPPATVTPLGPDSAAGVAGQPLTDSLRVRVGDAYGNPVPGAAVLWKVLSGGGSISPPSTTTRPDGTAAAAWTLGAQTDTPQVAEAMAGLSTRTRFTAKAGLPDALVITRLTGDLVLPFSSGGAQSPTLAVRVTAPDGRPLAGVQVNFVQVDSPSLMEPRTLTTDAAGEARIDWYIPVQAGTYRITATVAGHPLSQVQFAIQREKGAPFLILLEVHPGNGIIDVTATPVDALRQKLPGAVINWSVLAGGGSVSPASAPADANGEVHAVWTLGPSGLQTLRATLATGGAPQGVNWDAETPISLEKVHPDTIFSNPEITGGVPCRLPNCATRAFFGQSGAGVRSATVTAGDKTVDLTYQTAFWYSNLQVQLVWDFDFSGQAEGWKQMTWNVTDWLGRSVEIQDSVYWTKR